MCVYVYIYIYIYISYVCVYLSLYIYIYIYIYHTRQEGAPRLRRPPRRARWGAHAEAGRVQIMLIIIIFIIVIISIIIITIIISIIVLSVVSLLSLLSSPLLSSSLAIIVVTVVARGWTSTVTLLYSTVDFRNFIVFFWAENLAHWNPTSCQTKHPQLVCSELRLSNWNFEDWIMETDRGCSA